MPAHLTPVNGTRLFVDDRGPADAPPVLFIHGGPGQSAFDFGHFQADHLARHVRIIAVDQRGLLRSDPLPEGAEISTDAIIADYEALRQTLGISAWTIIGHSSGGHTAIRYAREHPTAVTAAVFDCPAFDCDLTDRHRLPIAAAILDEIGDHESAAACRAFAERPERLTAADETYKVMQRIGARYNELFFRTPAAIEAFEKGQAESGFTREQWARGLSHLPLVADMYIPTLDLLPGLTPPSMLVHGRHDLVAAPAVIDAYRELAPGARVHTFEDSAHFPYIEEPEAYADVVSGFVLSATNLTR
ncbi:alpha/beta fold hydrolase [Phytomonospora endophytica]|uniref:Proline iminopeptidase n=1 Tax=Phytomonospora endophytica TaxID=714109 RepID=A0A841FEK0_9ACTN|nr:alpha/beta hydrolase [Phytomonospora endophytica]MBB6035721.1 proline iminopeptidase [Phytomonospora endophytica]GIG69602.1 proline iminopeptidase [Phytomonospora endophytica]